MEKILSDFIVIILEVVVVVGALLTSVAYMTWLERKLLGHMQHRFGPLRVGPRGLLQPLADGIKLFLKEDITPEQANKVIYYLAPAIAAITAFGVFAFIPFARETSLFGLDFPMVISNMGIGLLYIIGLSSLGVYGVVLGGWSSGSKYSLLGSLRAASQMISYELPLVLSMLGVILLAGSLNMVDIVKAQNPYWFILFQPLGFLIYLTCGIAECKRSPFDLPEAESELVGGFHTEYSSMKFALFFLAEYAHIIAVSAIGATLFLGGWRGPFLPPILWFCIKVFALAFFFIWIRATFPRLRYDQLMNLGWKFLLPLALLNVMITSAFLVME